ncbi:unnamed protein product [Paramecium octaurelia]|uniref:Uncharacterized protein n=1 Tax=Paramecium octaurelia TaxID=43137 RepID=A0A8S1YLK6_PAROT|nr:unnamed protein product [Paramecium octaurelia]
MYELKVNKCEKKFNTQNNEFLIERSLSNQTKNNKFLSQILTTLSFYKKLFTSCQMRFLTQQKCDKWLPSNHHPVYLQFV